MTRPDRYAPVTAAWPQKALPVPITRDLLVGLCLLALACAILTFIGLKYFPHYVPGGEGNSAGRTTGIFLGFLSAVLAVSGLILLAIAYVWRDPHVVRLSKTNAALLTVALLVLWMTYRPSSSSPGDAFAAPIWGLVVLMWLVQLGGLGALMLRLSTGEVHACAPWLFLGLVVAMLGGAMLGVLIWSERVATRIASQAERLSNDLPYCIDVAGRAAQRRFDITGLMARARRVGPYATTLHARLIIEGPAGERYYHNWSYRRGRFETNILVTHEPLCRPAPHFARDWM